jgi:hypothetical protein
MTSAVDPEVIKERSKVPSESATTRENFRGRVLERDGRCVFSGEDAEHSEAMHIIPHGRGSECVRRSGIGIGISLDVILMR